MIIFFGFSKERLFTVRLKFNTRHESRQNKHMRNSVLQFNSAKDSMRSTRRFRNSSYQNVSQAVYVLAQAVAWDPADADDTDKVHWCRFGKKTSLPYVFRIQSCFYALPIFQSRSPGHIHKSLWACFWLFVSVTPAVHIIVVVGDLRSTRILGCREAPLLFTSCKTSLSASARNQFPAEYQILVLNEEN